MALFRHYLINRVRVLALIAAGYDALVAYDMAICEDNRNDWHYSHAGYMGDLWEFAVSFYLSGGRRVRKAIGATYRPTGDARTPLLDITEIKQSCGELPRGNKWQFVIYCPYPDFSKSTLEQGYVFNRDDWEMFLESYNGRGSFVRWDSTRDKGHIQSFYVSETIRPKASKPIRAYIDEYCSTLLTLGEWIEDGFTGANE